MEKSEQTQSYNWILGIDVSKQSIDACLIRSLDGQIFESKFNNNASGFRQLKQWCKQQQCECDATTLCCMEHTGLYTRLLVHYLVSREVAIWLESSLQIKRSQGLLRGKSDRIDAQRIACYAHVFQNKANVLEISTLTLEKLKDLQSNRKRLLTALQMLRTSTEELKQFDSSTGKLIDQTNREALAFVDVACGECWGRHQQFYYSSTHFMLPNLLVSLRADAGAQHQQGQRVHYLPS